MKGGLLLDVIVRKCPAPLKLLANKNEIAYTPRVMVLTHRSVYRNLHPTMQPQH